jgi:hypothetical protein
MYLSTGIGSCTKRAETTLAELIHYCFCHDATRRIFSAEK